MPLKTTLAACGWIAACALCACSAGPRQARVPAFDQPVASESGDLTAWLTSAPETVPVRGENQIWLELRETATGAVVEGLELAVLPFMPAMGHGSATRPTVTELGAGRYQLDDVSLTMSGLWELQTTISGPLADYVAPRFEVE